MWHMYEGYHFWGMHLIWWIFWVFFVMWIFILPVGYTKREKQDTPFQILQKRFAAGEITKEEYEEKKTILKKDKLD